MPVFTYKALNSVGKEATGVLNADSPRDARLKLKSMNLFAVDIEPMVDVKTGQLRSTSKIPLVGKGRIKPDELAMLTRQIATMLQSGIQIMQALTALIEQLDNKRLRAVMLAVRERVAGGVAFSEALNAYPRYFDPLYVNMIKAGEASGNLDKIMIRISDYLLSSHRIQSKVKGALTYPIFIMIVAAGMVVFMLTFVLPQVTSVITSNTNARLPLPTEMLLAVSSFLSRFWWVIFAGIIALVLFIKGLKKTKEGRHMVDSLKMKIPFLGQLFKKAAVSRFCVTFATLLESGLPAVESLRIVKNTVNNQVLADIINEASNKIVEGSDISAPFKKYKVFPPVLVYMISIGEESGQLPELLKQLSKSYDEEIEIQSQRLTTMLEPLLILVTSLIIGAIVISVLMPVLEMSNIK
ncbi:MAG: type II secretion system F family protein [Planctomycetes bacterium]|nr:type II secretion system F family protein [Planctomycetota bacterium]